MKCFNGVCEWLDHRLCEQIISVKTFPVHFSRPVFFLLARMVRGIEVSQECQLKLRYNSPHKHYFHSNLLDDPAVLK